MLSSNGDVSNSSLIGELDPQAAACVSHSANQRGETDASERMRDFGEGLRHATGWRIALRPAAIGVVIEVSEGLWKKYRPLFAEAKMYGN